VVPTIFLNGRYLRGPQPYETVRALVLEELAATGVTVPEGRDAEGSAPSPAPTSTTAAPSPVTTSTTPTSPPTAVLTLPSDRVARALANRRALARDLGRPPMDPGPGYEGHALVRVERVQSGGLYELLGLQPGDVLMTVNGALVLDDGNALFDALRDRATVTVQVLRGGLPQTFEYRIE
jgi:hypothetical protein